MEFYFSIYIFFFPKQDKFVSSCVLQRFFFLCCFNQSFFIGYRSTYSNSMLRMSLALAISTQFWIFFCCGCVDLTSHNGCFTVLIMCMKWIGLLIILTSNMYTTTVVRLKLSDVCATCWKRFPVRPQPCIVYTRHVSIFISWCVFIPQRGFWSVHYVHFCRKDGFGCVSSPMLIQIMGSKSPSCAHCAVNEANPNASTNSYQGVLIWEHCVIRSTETKALPQDHK